MADVLEKCSVLEDMNVWPTQPRLKAASWLENFKDTEKPYAHALLSSFMYFNEYMCAQLLKSAFNNISTYFYSFSQNDRRAKWEEFLATTIFSYPAGENPSKSGPTMLRMARQELGFVESRMYTPDDALEALDDGKSKYIVFVDDFVGSGDQFTTTWHEEHNRRGKKLSYNKLCENGIVAFYVPYIATQYGLTQIGLSCKNHHIFPGQVIHNNYCAFGSKSVIWPSNLAPTAHEFIEETSKRAGLKEHRGHHGLGFTVAAHNSIPDVSLPLLFHKSDSWRPLMERK